ERRKVAGAVDQPPAGGGGEDEHPVQGDGGTRSVVGLIDVEQELAVGDAADGDNGNRTQGKIAGEDLALVFVQLQGSSIGVEALGGRGAAARVDADKGVDHAGTGRLSLGRLEDRAINHAGGRPAGAAEVENGWRRAILQSFSERSRGALAGPAFFGLVG